MPWISNYKHKIRKINKNFLGLPQSCRPRTCGPVGVSNADWLVLLWDPTVLMFGFYVDGLVQDCSNSSVLALELLQSCTKPSMWSVDMETLHWLLKFSLFALLTEYAKLVQCIVNIMPANDLEWGLLDLSPPFHYFCHFFCNHHWLTIEYHVHIWQVSPQLDCGDTCKIWTWLNRADI